jgi:hypothetical protein
MITDLDVQIFKAKQLELGLTDEQCDKIISYLKFGLGFSDAESEFEYFIIEYLEKKVDGEVCYG